MPVMVLQTSPPSQGGLGAWQETLLWKTQSPLPLQWSTVQALASALQGVLKAASGCGSHMPVMVLQTSPPSQGGLGAWQETLLWKTHMPLPLQ
jgi:hypothetical protein